MNTTSGSKRKKPPVKPEDLKPPVVAQAGGNGSHSEVPTPFDEAKDPNRFWEEDPGDEVLPKRKGFLTDYVYRHRGKEISTLFTLWSGLFALATAIKREAWLKFGEKRLYTNFYCILVGPAGIAHKSEVIDDTVSILEDFGSKITDEQFRFMKYLNIVADKASPEALLEAMQPRYKEPKGKQGFFFTDATGNRIIDPKTGRPLWYGKTAEAAIIAHEFATFAGQQRYNVGLTDLLLALYDCNRPFMWRSVKRGRVVLKRIHTTLLAGTTLGSFRSSLSDTVRTDGFLSRSVLVYCPKTEGRCFSLPRKVESAPDHDCLCERLAWIASHTVGEFDLSKEAFRYYDKWYRKWHKELQDESQLQGVKSRIHILILKVALLIHAQGYNTGANLIDLQDVKDAVHIVKRTWFEALPMLRGFEDGNKPFIGRLEGYIRERYEVGRTQLQRQGKFSAAELREGIALLNEEGKVEIHRGGEIRDYPSTDGSETYRWIGERWLGSATDE